MEHALVEDAPLLLRMLIMERPPLAPPPPLPPPPLAPPPLLTGMGLQCSDGKDPGLATELMRTATAANWHGML
jgi:hypothetical protein